MAVPWRRATQPSTVELIQEYIIQSGTQPGDKLPSEAEFAQEIGIGRTGVREGIQALQALGIVEVQQGRGTFLRSGGTLDGLGSGLTFWSRISLAQGGTGNPLKLIAQVRVALESSLVLEVLGKHDQDSFLALEKTVAEMESLAEQGKLAPRADREFHHLLYQPLENWVLDSILFAFWDAVGRSTGHEAYVGDPIVIAGDHRAIVNALRDEDRDALTEAMTAHFAPVLPMSAAAST